MAKMTNLAHPYVNAVFNLAAADSLDKWLGILENLAVAVSSLEFTAIIDNPKINQQVLVDILVEASRENNSNLQNFLQLLVKEGRIKVLPEIYELFRHKVEAYKNSALAIIQSAFVMPDNEKNEFAAILAKKLGKTVNVEVMVMPELIGGVKILVNDLVIDASVKGSLEKMAAQVI